MDAHHVVYTLLSAILVQIASSTDILVAYEHDVLLLRAANSDHFSDPVPLVTPPLHSPHGLAYRPPSRDTTTAGGELVFVSDIQSGEASVFALELSGDRVVQRREPVIKRSPQRLSHAVYSAAQNSLFVSSLVPVPGVSQSHLSADITKHWSPEPSLVTSAQIGTVRGVTLDQCTGKLYWSETSNSSSSVSVLPTSQLSSATRVLPLPSSSPSFYQGLHYDETSKSLIIAVTDSDNFTTSSCRFISHRETHDTNEETFVPGSSFNEPGYEMSIIAENISDCYPFALSTDQDYIYFSDWSRSSVMRLNKNDPADLVTLFATPPSKSFGRLRFGAFDVLALNDYGLQWENSCSVSESTSAGPSSQVTDKTSSRPSDAGENEFSSSEGPIMKTVPINNYQKDAGLKSLLPTPKNEDKIVTDEVFKPFTPATISTSVVLLTKDEESLPPDQNLLSIVAKGPRDSLKRHTATRSGVASTDSENPEASATSNPSVVLQHSEKSRLRNAYKIEAGHSQNPDINSSEEQPAQLQHSAIWFPQLSREELVLTIFVLLILCAILFVLSTVLWICHLQSWLKSKSGSCAGRGSNGRRPYNVKSDPTTRAHRNECAVDIEHTSYEGTNGTTDLIIDLSSQDDIKVNSDVPASTGRQKKKKKTFGPKNGSIKHLISKSFTKDGNKGSSTGCPGLQSSDGVTLNIEDCCQMTLCETPCYTSVQKEGKGYRSSGAATDDDRTTLLDDQQHTFC